VQEEQRGLAHAVSLCEAFVDNEPFCVFLGDNIFQDTMQPLLRGFEASGDGAVLVLGEVADPSRFGVADIRDGAIHRVVEKPSDPPSNLAIAGVYLFRPNVFDAIRRVKPSWRNELEITDAIQLLIDGGVAIRPYKLAGWWIDAGKPDAIILGNQLVLEDMAYTSPPAPDDERVQDSVVSHRVVIGPGSRIVRSTVRGPVIIGENTTIEDSYIGPYTAIGDNVTVVGSEVEASIIMNNCEIHQVAGRIDSSLLAENAHVVSQKRLPDTHRFVLAENSFVQF
jgi:glucose-1-phosphate thymidylyltransferase